MNRYYFTTKSYITHEVVVLANSEDKAWDIMQSGGGKETEVDSNCYSEELDSVEKVEENTNDND
jgi:hypothetical protein